MAIPTSVTDLSETPSSNGPNGGVDVPNVLDDYIRAHGAIIRQQHDLKGVANGIATLTSLGQLAQQVDYANLVNVPASSAGDALKDTIQTQGYTRFTAGGTADAITGTLSPAITSYVAGLRVTATPLGANTLTAPTINLNSLGVKTVKKKDTSGSKVALAAGDYNVSGPFNFEYDGTDFVLLDPLTQAASSVAVTVRQTVLGGPVDTAGLPSLMPATSSGSSVTSQNVSASAPLVVAAANGFGASGNVDRVGQSTSNLTWTGLTVTNGVVNYGYVDVAANGIMTPGVTTVAPIYQQGGTPATTNNQATFNIGQMQMYVGNGSTAPQTYRVFMWEGTGNGTNVAGIVTYAYRGYAKSSPITLANATGYTFNHNVGVTPILDATLINITADAGFVAGEQAHIDVSGTGYNNTGCGKWRGRMQCGFSVGSNGMIIFNKTSLYSPLTTTSWNAVLEARRGWGGA